MSLFHRNYSRNGAAESTHIDFSEKYDTSDLKGRSAVVTGASTGMGRAFSVALAEAGVYVILADVNVKDGEELEKELTAKGKHAKFVETNVTSWDSQIAAFKAAIDFSPGKTVDIVIASAGLGEGGSNRWVANIPKDPTPPPTRVVDVNFTGVYLTSHAALWAFKNHPGNDVSWSKHIVYVSSLAGYSSMTLVQDYAGSKWGVRGIFRALRGAPGVLGDNMPAVRCNLIAPSWVRTPMTKEFVDTVEKLGMPIAEPEDAAWIVMRMCADQKVIGRAATVAAKRLGFDLDDEPEGLDAGVAFNDKDKREILLGKITIPRE